MKKSMFAHGRNIKTVQKSSKVETKSSLTEALTSLFISVKLVVYFPRKFLYTKYPFPPYIPRILCVLFWNLLFRLQFFLDIVTYQHLYFSFV